MHKPPQITKYWRWPYRSAMIPSGTKLKAETRYGSVTNRDASIPEKPKFLIMKLGPMAMVVNMIAIVSILSTTKSQ